MRSGSNLSSQGPAPKNYDEWIEFARTATHGWHDEERLYPYDNPHFEEAWGHFTQMVWRNTSRVGCAVGNCGPGVEFPGRFYCCEYVWLLLYEILMPPRLRICRQQYRRGPVQGAGLSSRLWRSFLERGGKACRHWTQLVSHLTLDRLARRHWRALQFSWPRRCHSITRDSRTWYTDIAALNRRQHRWIPPGTLHRF